VIISGLVTDGVTRPVVITPQSAGGMVGTVAKLLVKKVSMTALSPSNAKTRHYHH